MRILLCAALAFFVFPLGLRAQETEKPIKTTLCEIKKDPVAFNKKLVEVSGYASHGFEDSMFEDPTCFEGSKWPGIWMEYGGTVATDTMYCCGVTQSKTKKQLVVQGIHVPLVDDESFRKFDTLLHSKPEQDVSIQATVRGRIFVAPTKAPLSGYGHMGCCMLFAVEQVLSIDSTEAGLSTFQLARQYATKPMPCDGINQSITEQRKAELAPKLAKQLSARGIVTKNVDVLASYRYDGWSILYVDTNVSDEAFLFYRRDPLKGKYITLWSGAAMRSEQDEMQAWTLKNAQGIPPRLAGCFAWYVTNGR